MLVIDGFRVFLPSKEIWVSLLFKLCVMKAVVGLVSFPNIK